jgi:protein gp37
MSDLFHEQVPLTFIRRLFETMHACPQHTFQILTKRGARLRTIGPKLCWTDNIWIGVSVENGTVTSRIWDLVTVPAAVRFISCEPLIGPLEDLPLMNIHWVIVGGESGPEARPMREEWVFSILRQCRAAGVPFFFKQWGGVRKDLLGRTLGGRTYDELPVAHAQQDSPATIPAASRGTNEYSTGRRRSA